MQSTTRIQKSLHLYTVLVLMMFCSPLWAKTLVQPGSTNDSYVAGVATSWHSGPQGVVLDIEPGEDMEAMATILRESLLAVQVRVEGQHIIVSGMSEESLLQKLVGLEVGDASDVAAVDPLAALNNVQNVVALAGPEAGGSIRASKPSIIIPTPRNELAQAEVVEIKRGIFPEVALVLRIRRAPQAGEHRTLLRRNKRIRGRVVFSTQGDPAAIDFSNAETQRNLAAYYLSRGDKIYVHAHGEALDSLEFDYIQRR